MSEVIGSDNIHSDAKQSDAKTSEADTTEAVVKSPCISVCVLNENDICEGCYRSAAEITDWSILGNEKKKQVLSLTRQRFKQMNKHLLL